METKSLLIGIISFIAGGLLVSTAAVTFDKSENKADTTSMTSMVSSLNGKSGDEYDKEFLSQMIVHHEGAIDMAKLSKNKARHDEIKRLSDAIISAQEEEITKMKRWQTEWNYNYTQTTHPKSH